MLQIVEDGIDADRTPLALEIPAHRLRREGTSHVAHAVAQDAAEHVDVADREMLQHVPDHHGVEQAVEVLHRGLGIEVEVFQEWESAQDEVVLEEFPGFGAGDAVWAVQLDELPEGQGTDRELDEPAREVGTQFAREHRRVGSGEVQVAIPVDPQRIDHVFPSRNLLHLVQEHVGAGPLVG